MPDANSASTKKAHEAAGIRRSNLSPMIAFNIAMNGLKIRFWRSIVTASGIFLSIAFFAYVFSDIQLAPHLNSDERARQIWLVVMSVLVSVVGISNSMLMSVTERFREIGTMKCLGAPNDFVTKVFFIEAIFMGLAASAPGCLLGLVSALTLLWFQDHAGAFVNVTAAKLLGVIFYSVGLGALMTFIATIVPAQQAANMPAAAALRTDI